MRFLVSAPEKSASSAGINALYELSEDLKTLGYNSEIALWTQFHNLRDDDILIYPEVVVGNPLHAKNVVRYVLNREGILTGNKMNAGENDFIFAWPKLYYPSSHANLLKFSIPSFFNDLDTKFALERNIDCTYIGKGSIYKNCPIIPNTLEINKHNPINKPALADLLRNTRFLYTYDTLTSIINESILCGAILIPLHWHPFSEEEYNQSDYKFPYANLTQHNVIIPLNYVNERKQYIDNIKNTNLNYLSKLNEIATQMVQHFKLSSI